MGTFREEWMTWSLLLCGMVIIYVQGLPQMHFNFALPQDNVTSVKTDGAFYCNCKVMCYSSSSCKAVTIFNVSNKMECTFSNHSINPGHLISNTSAVTFLVPPDDFTCPPPYVQFPGVGCVYYVWENKTYDNAKLHCQQNLQGNLYVADTPYHFQRTVTEYFRNYLRMNDTIHEIKFFVGIEKDLWLNGRSPAPLLEWAFAEPDPGTEECAIVRRSSWDIYDVACSRLQYFVCEKKLWKLP